MSIRHLVLDTFVHLAPLKMLEDLDPYDAIRPPAPRMHSVAGLVGHMEFWQHWFLQRCEGHGVPMAARATDGWPEVTADTWPDVLARFERGLRRAADLGDDGTALELPLMPSIDFPPLAHYTRRDALVHLAQHNSHHLGQVVSARLFLGLWPPRAGSWTW